MVNQETNDRDTYTIDILHVARLLLKRAWLIILCGLLGASIGFSIASFAIAPTYSAYIKLYVNNSSISLGNTNFSISASELTAAQSLVKTYGEILNSRSTLQRVINKANINYTWKQLAGMISYAPSNETEIMKVVVTCEDPYEASEIANTIADILPVRISEIIDGASMEVVDSAIPDLAKIAPSITRYTAIGLVIGVLLCVGVLFIFAMLDDTIHDEEYVLRTVEFPILGNVPDLLNMGGKSYKSYKYYYKHYYKNNESYENKNQ